MVKVKLIANGLSHKIYAKELQSYITTLYQIPNIGDKIKFILIVKEELENKFFEIEGIVENITYLAEYQPLFIAAEIVINY